jgi:hypothetical protein
MFFFYFLLAACFKLLGDLLHDCGWTTALSDADIATSGTAESFLSCSNTKKPQTSLPSRICLASTNNG